MFCLKRRRELIPLKDASQENVPFLSALIKKSLLSVIPFNETKTEIVPSQSSVITMDV